MMMRKHLDKLHEANKLKEAPQEEETPQVMIPPIQSPTPETPQGDGFFIYRINGVDILEEIQHQLRGEVFVPGENGGGKFEAMFDPWLNEDGINKVMYLIYANGINKNTLLGNLSKEEIYTRCYKIWTDLSLLFFKKHSAYGVPRHMRDLLIESIVYTIHSGLSRSEGGKEGEQLSSATQRHEIFSHQEQEKGGFKPFGKFKFGG